MHYSNFGLINTNQMFRKALSQGYAIPAFNFFNMETLQAILKASATTKSPVILAVSESALAYMGKDILMGMIAGAKYHPGQIALHLDHGHSYEACKSAIDLGFSSVMFDGSTLPLKENIRITKKVVNYAHKFNVSVEAELGILSGTEDKYTNSKHNLYTDPIIAKSFISQTNIDSLAISIGTSHGAYKYKGNKNKLHFDILKKIVELSPKTPLVLHGASTIPQKFIKSINSLGGKLENAKGISPSQLRTAISMHIVKINIDSDSRLAFTSAIKNTLHKKSTIFDPRIYLTEAMHAMLQNCIQEIQGIMGSANKI